MSAAPSGIARLLTAAEAGRLLNVPHTWLLREARAGRVPHVRLGRYVRFPQDGLLEWVQGIERGAGGRGRPSGGGPEG